MKKKQAEVAEVVQWSIPARVVRHITVTVEARTEDEALEKFELMDWLHEQHGETCDFRRAGKIKCES